MTAHIITLDADLFAWIDERARSLSLSRSDYIRMLVLGDKVRVENMKAASQKVENRIKKRRKEG